MATVGGATQNKELKMRHKFILAMLVLPATLALATTAWGGGAAGATVQRDWLTADGSKKVRIASCGKGLCGTIVWLKDPLDEATRLPSQDDHNPDQGLRSRPIIGLQIFAGFHPASEGWAGGTVYDPNSGKTYASKLSSNPDGTLKVEGCIAVFCQTRIWGPAK